MKDPRIKFVEKLEELGVNPEDAFIIALDAGIGVVDKEYLEDVLDITTIGKIMQVAGGVDINQDPNSLTATV